MSLSQAHASAASRAFAVLPMSGCVSVGRILIHCYFSPCDPPSSSLLRPSGTPLLGGHASAHLREAGPGRRRGELDYQGVGCTPFLKRQDPGRRAHSAESASPPVAESERLALPIESSHAALFDQLLKSLFGQNTARKNLTIDHALYLQDSFRPIEHSDLPPLGKS